jgi:hypothetical protein
VNSSSTSNACGDCNDDAGNRNNNGANGGSSTHKPHGIVYPTMGGIGGFLGMGCGTTASSLSSTHSQQHQQQHNNALLCNPSFDFGFVNPFAFPTAVSTINRQCALLAFDEFRESSTPYTIYPFFGGNAFICLRFLGFGRLALYRSEKIVDGKMPRAGRFN